MFDDADETLREVLLADVPINRDEVDITFERPTREWSSRLSKPTVNLFLFDVRERTDFRDDSWVTTRTPDGKVVRSRGPRRVDLAYQLTAWTKEPQDEHRILGRVVACLYRQAQVARDHLRGALQNATVPVLLRSMAPDYLAKPADFWGVMDNEMRASLTWVATVPVDVFAPITGPMILTREVRYRDRDHGPEEYESFIRIGGLVHAKGDPASVVAGALVRVDGTGSEAQTGGDGRFVLPWVRPGRITLRVERAGQAPVEREVVVPGDGYDIEV
ncbi:MAG: Pvc16 family protein [Dehalococcoidia bacterium]